MSDRRLNEQGCHCSRRVLAVAFLAVAPDAWSQSADPAPPTKPPARETAAPQQSQPAKPLELYVGQAKDLLSDSQWAALMAIQSNDPTADEEQSSAEPQVVEVTGETPAPEIPGGIASIFWAMRHPTQAWRILAPAPP